MINARRTRTPARAPLLEGQSESAAERAQEPADPSELAVEAEPKHFSVRGEAWTMWALGWPMVVSFICRIGMASTDAAFVGHLDNTTSGLFLDGQKFTGEQYLAAASLCDMVCNIMVVPPLAFNQVLNSLVGQALGSGKPRMAGTWLQLSVLFLTVSYVPFCILMYTCVGRVLRALGFAAPLCELADIYARWNVWWPIPNGVYQCMRFYFQAQNIPRPAMYNNLVFVVFNALSNWT